MSGAADSDSRKRFRIYRLRVAYHHTDAMRVAHHSNYIKWFEEARVEWLRDSGLMEFHHPYGPYVFAVIRLENRFFKPARFDDELEVWTQGRVERGLRVHFQYALWSARLNRVIADAKTELIALTDDFKPARLPEALVSGLQHEPWDDVWPPEPSV